LPHLELNREPNHVEVGRGASERPARPQNGVVTLLWDRIRLDGRRPMLEGSSMIPILACRSFLDVRGRLA
jgi:hypothetical protein